MRWDLEIPLEDRGTITDPWESSAIPSPNHYPIAEFLMEEAQGVYQTNWVYIHSHTPHYGKCSSKASSVEYLLPTISLEIAPLPEEFASNNDWPLFKTRQSAKQAITIQMWLEQLKATQDVGQIRG